MATKRILAALLASLMLIPAMSACSDSQDDAKDTTAASETTLPADIEPAETGRAQAKDNLPEGYSLNGKTFTIVSRTQGCQIDVDGNGEETGDVINDAVYNRTLSVEDRLKVEIQSQVITGAIAEFGSAIEQTILAGDDVWQLVVPSSNTVISYQRDYLFQNAADNLYLDFDQPWWWTEAMKEVSLDGETIRYIVGDISLTNYYYCGGFFFNKRLYTDNGLNPEDLYNLVLDGKWTYDKLREQASSMYKDVDGDGAVSDADILGFYLDTTEYVKFMEYGADVRRYSRDDKGHPVMDYDLDRASNTAEKLRTLLLESQGIKFFNIKNRDYAPFVEGRAVFYGALLGDTMNANLRNMEDEYGLIPYPKLNEEQENYTNFIHNSSYYYTIPITCKNADEAGAVLEAMCSESYRSVIELFFETALKAKYSHDSQSAQCIDIIRDISRKYFLAEYTFLGGGFLIGDQVRKTSNNFSSDYAAKVSTVNQQIQDLVKTLTNKSTGQ